MFTNSKITGYAYLENKNSDFMTAVNLDDVTENGNVFCIDDTRFAEVGNGQLPVKATTATPTGGVYMAVDDVEIGTFEQNKNVPTRFRYQIVKGKGFRAVLLREGMLVHLNSGAVVPLDAVAGIQVDNWLTFGSGMQLVETATKPTGLKGQIVSDSPFDADEGNIYTASGDGIEQLTAEETSAIKMFTVLFTE